MNLSFVSVDAGSVLFGGSLFVFGALIVCVVALRSHMSWRPYVLGLLLLQILLLVGMVVLDVFTPSARSTSQTMAGLSLQFATHRYLLIQLPLLLLVTSVITLLVFGERLQESFARVYSYFVVASVTLAFVVFLLIGFESLL